MSRGSFSDNAPLNADSFGKGVLRSGHVTGLPLVPCPKCGADVIELTARTGMYSGRVFFKCVLNEKDIPGKCRFFMWHDQYVELLCRRGMDNELCKGTLEAARVCSEDGDDKSKKSMEQKLDKIIEIEKILVVLAVVSVLLGCVCVMLVALK